MKQIANKNARRYVQNLELFKGSNLFSETRGEYYVVYSYGHHYPMLVHNKKTDQWYRNKDRYSVSTSKQIGQCAPYDVAFIDASTEELKTMLNNAKV